jgi:hypothetical protein
MSLAVVQYFFVAESWILAYLFPAALIVFLLGKCRRLLSSGAHISASAVATIRKQPVYAAFVLAELIPVLHRFAAGTFFSLL